MIFSMREHTKVIKVEGGVAYLEVRIPLEFLDALPSLLDHAEYACRWLKTQSRMRSIEMIGEARRAAVAAGVANKVGTLS